MAGRYNADDYEPVEDRLRAFWLEHAKGRILTDLIHRDDRQFIVKAEVWPDEMGGAMATGYAEETVGSTHVNKTSALENCETSAIGRALANAGYAPKGKRPSREEMEKANRASPPRVTRAAEARDALRAICNEKGWDLKAVADRYATQTGVALQDTEDHDRIEQFTRWLEAAGGPANEA